MVATLDEFANELAKTDDGVVCEFDQGARFAVSADRTVEAGMALHDFAGGADTLVVDHDAESITVVGDGTEYTFRQP
ncbi:hypothetical protein [Halococcus saccharolyticus]|uniref:Halobacterial output domain-containing protein n=1 Tax=Halococcus saccharolyticus DSM 5350 TaxID=1227455 RepID=M0MI97_9EURY|nr:hypothetical protein [Halococcus saccharolyticus]EMA44444.1 hypothetical protein C449_10563 [Halococcus saccharolyticus DSM 5350]